MIRVTIWNEYVSEVEDPITGNCYPDGIHAVLAAQIGLDTDVTVSTATLKEPENGLPQKLLDQTDVLMWWGHRAHGAVDDCISRRVIDRVLMGMGLIALHSAHLSKPFKALMGTRCGLHFRVSGERELMWVVDPSHDIAHGLPLCIEIGPSEVYAEPFEIPSPDELIFISSFEGGEVFRSGCCWRRGSGRIFYFGPGHQTFPIYQLPAVGRILRNAVRWATPRYSSLELPKKLPRAY